MKNVSPKNNHGANYIQMLPQEQSMLYEESTAGNLTYKCVVRERHAIYGVIGPYMECNGVNEDGIAHCFIPLPLDTPNINISQNKSFHINELWLFKGYINGPTDVYITRPIADPERLYHQPGFSCSAAAPIIDIHCPTAKSYTTDTSDASPSARYILL